MKTQKRIWNGFVINYKSQSPKQKHAGNNRIHGWLHISFLIPIS